MENTIIEWAKRFASAGYYVFPLYNSKNGSLKPYGWAKNTVKSAKGEEVDPIKIIPATIDLEEINKWPERVRAGYNTSISAYGVIGINKIILDLDVKKNKKGVTEYNQLSEKYKFPKAEMVVKTKSGGYHLYFAKSKKYEKSEIKSISGLNVGGIKYEGIDVRGDGGMVIGPLSESTEDEWVIGEYALIKGNPEKILTILPDEITKSVVKTTISAMINDVDNMVDSGYSKDPEDVIAVLRRGEIPAVLPDGQRNEGFYAFINALKSKNIPKESAKILCLKLAQSCGDPESLHESVNIDDMLARIYTVIPENPYDVARDLINRGLFQLSEQRNKLAYVMLNENPYIRSTSIHDIESMRTLLIKYAKIIEQPSGKSKLVNPMDVAIHNLGDENRADILGFKPGAPDVFNITSDVRSKKVLNLYLAPNIPTSSSGLDDTIYDEFKFIISRIFGDEGSREYTLGLDFSAWFIQNPHLKPAICPYVMSRHRGVGKSLYISVMSAIAGVNKQGDKQCRLVKLDEIGGRFFNPSGVNLLMFDEVQFPVHRDMRKESTTFWRHMKDLVTSTMSSIEIKGGGTFQVPNLAGMFLSGNTGSHFPIEEYDRRIWVIDNNPSTLNRGIVDKLFELTRETKNHDTLRKYVETLRYHLKNHKITLQLDTMRAPMSDVKMEMYKDSMSDIEEWWHSHFDNEENLLAKNPVISKSAILYLISTSDRLLNTKYREDPDSTFRDLKRKGLIHPIRTKGNQSSSRNITNVPIVTMNGDVVENDKREVLYTSRNHGEFDEFDNVIVLRMYFENIEKIKNWKSQTLRNRSKVTTAQDLIH